MPTPAPAVSVQEVVQRVLQRTDLERVGTGGIVSQPEVLGLINLYMNRLAMEIDKTYEYYRESFYNVQTVAGTQLYALPADFYKLLGVGLVDRPGRNYQTWTPLNHWDMANQSVPGTGFMQFTNGAFTYMTYRVIGSGVGAGPNIEFRPTNSSQLVAVLYSPQAPRFVSLNETMPGWMALGWEEYLVCGAASMINAKQEIEDQMTVQIMAEILAQVKAFAPNRDAFQPETVKRTWMPRSRWPFGGGFYGGTGTGGSF